VNTTGFGGKNLSKSAIIHTNDPVNQKVTLTISGDVDKFATVVPERLRLYGPVGEKIEGKVSIVPEEKFAFNIVDVRAIKGENIRYKIEKTGDDKSSGYLLTVENQMEKVGRYFDSIHLKTDSKIRPVITVRVYGNIYQKRQHTTTKQ
jgi:hypothetical protein